MEIAKIREHHSLMPEGAVCECGQMADACDVRYVLAALDAATDLVVRQQGFRRMALAKALPALDPQCLLFGNGVTYDEIADDLLRAMAQGDG